MIKTVLAVLAVSWSSPASTARPPAIPSEPTDTAALWMMNYVNPKEKGRCIETTMWRALDGLKKQAKKYPASNHSYQFLRDDKEFVLRVFIRPAREMPQVFFFVQTKALCETKWRAYAVDPLWDYDENRSYRVTAESVIPPSAIKQDIERSKSR